MDCTGVVRTTRGGFPAYMTRVNNERFRKKATLTGPWLEEARYLGSVKSDKGTTVLQFSSMDGTRAWKYVLAPSRAGQATYGAIDVPGPMKQNGLGFEIPREPWWKEAPVTIWPHYKLEPQREIEPEPEKRKNLLAGLKPTLKLPPEVEATGGVYLDEEYTVDGTASICLDLDKLRGLGSRKYSVRLDWPLQLMLGDRYRFALKMRHENVSGLEGAEPFSLTLYPVGGWSSIEGGKAKYWPRPVREWFRVHDEVVVGRGGVPSGSYPVFGTIRMPGDSKQSGKVWLGGFIIEEAD
jgi:hypothetical protein